MSKISAVVLAAGKGTRMRSDLTKVLFEVYGGKILSHVTNSIINSGIEDISIVVSPAGDDIREYYADKFVYSVQHTPPRNRARPSERKGVYGKKRRKSIRCLR